MRSVESYSLPEMIFFLADCSHQIERLTNPYIDPQEKKLLARDINLIASELIPFENDRITEERAENFRKLINKLGVICQQRKELWNSVPSLFGCFEQLKNMSENVFKWLEKQNDEKADEGGIFSEYNPGRLISFDNDPRVGGGMCYGYFLLWAKAMLSGEKPFNVDPNGVYDHPIRQPLSTEVINTQLKSNRSAFEFFCQRKTHPLSEIFDNNNKPIELDQIYNILKELKEKSDRVFGVLVWQANSSAHIFGIKYHDNYYHALDPNVGWVRFSQPGDFVSYLFIVLKGYEIAGYTHLTINSYSPEDVNLKNKPSTLKNQLKHFFWSLTYKQAAINPNPPPSSTMQSKDVNDDYFNVSAKK